MREAAFRPPSLPTQTHTAAAPPSLHYRRPVEARCSDFDEHGTARHGPAWQMMKDEETKARPFKEAIVFMVC